ncbi:MAG TPA: DUF1236 domain-containing protein [Devosia sp.]|nr:DUF1236 domain-containing protein [Devosia sp.]
MSNRILTVAAALLLAATSAPVLAQDAVVLSPDQQTTIVQDFSGTDVTPVPSVDFDVDVGAAVPDTIELHPVPDSIVKVVPGYSKYEYFRIADGRTVIVEPTTKKVITVLK